MEERERKARDASTRQAAVLSAKADAEAQAQRAARLEATVARMQQFIVQQAQGDACMRRVARCGGPCA